MAHAGRAVGGALGTGPTYYLPHVRRIATLPLAPSGAHGRGGGEHPQYFGLS